MTIEQFKEEFGIIGNSKEINDLADVIMHIAKTDISVLIFGESGVGKEVFARAIHGYSNRVDKRLITVNCGAIPEGILESELFGHEKGSFTGAVENRKGYFEIADGGTLFLDEIAEMPLTTQVKLLRAIENKEFMRIGDEILTKVDVRIIAATNKDLQHEVDAKRFREDLFFRLKAVSLNIPPLRKRKKDIQVLVNHFLNEYTLEKKIALPKLENDALDLLLSYDWPGNVRELKNTIETAVVLNRNGTLERFSFLPLIQNKDENKSSRNLPVFLNRSSEEVDRELLYRALFEIKKDIMDLKDLIFHSRNEVNINPQKENHEVIPLNEMEKNAIVNALDVTRGNKRNAAKMLNISERTLYRKIKEYDL
ncbi:MAG: sigma-54 dependent transcriptional regulator [Ignavibacteriaceae bacterium]